MNRRLLLLLLLATAVALIVAIGTFSSPPPRGEPEAPRALEAADERERPNEPEGEVEVVAPEGGILVLGRDGLPAEAYVLTGNAVEREPTEKWRGIGDTNTDGVLPPADFKREPADLVIASSGAGVGGPIEWNPAGVVIRLGDGCVVSGHVRDPAGHPVAGVSISGPEVWIGVFTDADGAYRLAGFRPGRPMEIGAFAGTGRPDLVDIRFSSPPRAQPVLEFDVGGKQPATVYLPLKDTLVACPAPLAAGQEVEVTVNCPEFATATRRVVMPEGEEMVRVTLNLSPGGLPLFGLVVDTSGAPVADAEIFVGATPRLDADGVWTLRADHHGRFRLNGSVAGHHLIAIREAKGASRWLHLTPETEKIVLVIEDAGVVEGRVLDQDSGTPVEGATVALSFELRGHPEWTVESGPDGGYRFAGIPAGSFVWPWVRSTPRADPVEPGPDASYESGVRSRTEAVDQGLADVLEDFGDSFHRDLRAIRYPGGNCRFVLKFPEGTAVPESVQIEHESKSDRWWRTTKWEADLDRDDPAVTIWLGQGTHSVLFRSQARDATVEGIGVGGDGDLPD